MDNVVKLYKENNIGIVVLEEREHKNTFTKGFVLELFQTFSMIKQDDEIKAVVVHGYDNYFCCGGTKKELIELYEGIGQGNAQFTDLKLPSFSREPSMSDNSINSNSNVSSIVDTPMDSNFYDLLLNCEVPVISAMQGHALGGGLVFGCFADIIVMGIECIYSTNFMKYGFTPGMGATYIIPKKFGEQLGTEMLFTAKNYYGEELKNRGTSIKIVRKSKVIDTAMEIANDLVDKPLLSLKILKNQLASKTRSELPVAIEQECQMHKITFPQPEVRHRIEMFFGN